MICSKCSRQLDADQFYKNKNCLSGLSGKCKDCAKREAREWRLANIDRMRERDRIKSRTEEALASKRAWRQRNPELMRSYRKKWEERNPEKKAALRKTYRAANKEELAERTRALYHIRGGNDRKKTRARNTVNNAINAGKLARQLCWCGQVGRSTSSRLFEAA